MFSSLRASTWSLSARLLVGQVCLLAAVCVGIGAVTVLALHQYLIGEVDNQLRETAHRSAIMYGEPLPPLPPSMRDNRPPWPQPGPGPQFLDAPGQPIGMVAAVITNGSAAEAGVLGPGGVRAAVPPGALTQLVQNDGLRHPVTRNLDNLGAYRVIAVRSRLTGETLVIGLSMGNVNATLWRVALIFGVVTAVAMAVATTVGIWINRRALAPLTRVVATAGEVANLPLDRGEVQLPVRVSEPDANPYTEVGRLGLALNRMLDHISTALSTRQASESRVRQFVADASHELRTPLAAIRGYTELAQRKRDQVPDDVAHAMGRVESEAVRMTQLVEDLLLLARLDSGRPLEREPVDLSRLSADVTSDAHVAGPDHQWNLDVPTDPLYVTGDDARLHQVVANLLANARTHTPPGTSVTLSLHAEPDEAVLRVSDDGPGIPAELQSEVFERFARGDTSRSRKGGSTGLGLAIASAVVRAHSGSIELRSVPGWTEFTVRLPRAVES
ncbi:sensor histidine kinase [Mycolicibacterium helvum]|uniref:histidine kinase n=1 Tax=Mycolicibacterium helvum TaxID=1534349 RepID=A0A7I7T4P6_9MYCO|nr:HAMP domain-containing sensor histidine kinase [Mycolicibacterium helvum]BBY64264.1 two-component sensor histidine kinase [Mycolicibacterium helvum]